jgi:hypothetical protein
LHKQYVRHAPSGLSIVAIALIGAFGAAVETPVAGSLKMTLNASALTLVSLPTLN